MGGIKPVKVNVRIISATNRDLAEMAACGGFRKDLFWRLNVFPIHIPPLRERREDIPKLVNHMIRKKCGIFGIKNIPGVSAHTMKKLINYDWPGNIREIENIVERELITNHGSELSFESVLLAGRDYAEIRCSSAESNLLLDDAMKSHIIKILEQTKWRISGKNGAAEMLGINASTLRHRMRRLGLL